MVAAKDILAQLEHHVAHHAGDKHLADVVESPGRDAQQQDAAAPAAGSGAVAWGVVDQQADAAGDQDRPAARPLS
jgi:hypothetical protein